ncbi:Hypothetical protein PBC10988_31900 [Planctomycetales bacterium 10988]|nr:Hypothetical protein PBC10988_2490 [Planctomycetales bacterium 10988]QGJ71485.1 Hypothetical protein PBC10988_31900 [Planctomycetales bacterium 10988]
MTWYNSLSRRSQSKSFPPQETRLQLEQLETRHLLSAEPVLLNVNVGEFSDRLDLDLGGHSDPAQLTEVNGITFFTANDETTGVELWKSDGTSEGTVLVRDIVPGSGSPSISQLTNVNGTLLFTAIDGVHGRELWKSDGTSAGTTIVKDIVDEDLFT